MLLQRVLPLAIIPPPMPDSYACSDVYGRNVIPSVCATLVDTYFPTGNRPRRIYVNNAPNSEVMSLPFTKRSPGCTVSIEAAGPNAGITDFVTVSPNDLRGLAAYVIHKCPIENGGIGGFGSLGLENAVNYVREWGSGADPTAANDTAISHIDGTFLTVSVYGNPGVQRRPGDTDPIISGALAMYAAILLRSLGPLNNARFAARYLADLLHNRAIRMTRGGSMTWWEELNSPPGNARNNTLNDNQGENFEDPSDMTYQCDGLLGGAPQPTDCEKLAWSGLQPPDSVETLEPYAPKFYSQGTCAFGISSDISTTINWAHLLTAFDTLLNVCVQNPIMSAKGGRAYYGQQTTSSWINGKRDSVGGVNGWEALPLGINATIFKHDSNASMNCEWTLAQEGKDISMCGRN